MLAYHNKPELKSRALDIMAAHRKAETLAQNHGYWDAGKGCAMGCLLHDLGGQPNCHTEYERLLGIPAPLAHLEDRIFETLLENEAQTWPERFLGAIEPGADLSIVTWQFLDWLLSDLPKSDDATVTEAIKRVRTEVTGPRAKGEHVSKKTARAAARAADAAYAFHAAEAAWAAAYAAYAAADTAARAAADAAYAAARAARVADYTVADAVDAAHAVREKQADKLIELLKAA